jgi:hypothetical protein
MGVEITGFVNGIITLKFSGKLAQAEFAAMQQKAAAILDQAQHAGILAVVDGFEGWEKSGNWDDISFQVMHDWQIARMAIVCDDKWKDLALVFTGQGVRKFPIKYFSLSEVERARAWLTGKDS